MIHKFGSSQKSNEINGMTDQQSFFSRRRFAEIACAGLGLSLLAPYPLLTSRLSACHADSHPYDPYDDAPDPKSIDLIWDGKTLDGWMSLDGKPVSGGWSAKDGTISLKNSIIRTGHIVTRREFGDFELSFEWRLAKGGNSGIKYLVRKYDDRSLGYEYQIYDPNGKPVEAKNSTASIYDLVAPNAKAKSHPTGQWNTAKIVVRKSRIEHWLNDEKVVDTQVGDEHWNRRIAESKFNDVPDFGKNTCGRIMLTDHGSDVDYRKFQFQSFDTNC
jgi:hypothetical protein